ncbi:MAG TPA: TonB family protein [Terriglobales bacterium]|jgi:TonB family protein
MNAAVAQERWQGQVVNGKFPLLEWLGGSASTAVFRTELAGHSPQSAAIKIVRAESVNAAQQISRWKESATLAHSNLLRIFEAGHCQITGSQWVYCVTEYGEENLDQILPVRPLSSVEVMELLPPVLEALSYLHAKRLVHGRIKPSNIFAIKNQLKLSVDSIRSFDQAVKANQLTAYDPPEIESAVLSPASDVWSLGMTLVAILEQRPLTWSKSAQVDPAVPKSIPAPYSLIARECLRINPPSRCSVQRVRELTSQVPPAPQVALAPAPKKKIAAPTLAVIAAAILILAVVARRSTQKQLVPAVPTQEETAAHTRHTPATDAVPPHTTAVTKQPVVAAPKPTPMIMPSTSTRSAPSNAALNDARAGAVVERVLPNVPTSARLTIQGHVHVKVRVAVAPTGDVSSASLASPGPSRYFARLALESSQKWKFKPTGASQEWLIEYLFGRTATETTPVEVR